MFEIRGPARTHLIQIRVEPQFLALVRAHAARRKLNQADFIRECVRRVLLRAIARML
jgi:hypothetical protein